LSPKEKTYPSSTSYKQGGFHALREEKAEAKVEKKSYIFLVFLSLPRCWVGPATMQA